MSDPADVVSPARAQRPLGMALIAVAGAAALLGALYAADLGHRQQALALTVSALVTTTLGLIWWTRRSTRKGRVVAVALVPLSLLTWLLTDNATGVPLVGVAVCAVVLEFGVRVGLMVGALMLIGLAVLYLVAGVPFGGILANLVLTGVLIVLGVLAAQLVAQLERARQLAEAAAQSRRDEALAELDRALAAERMEQARALHDDLGQRLTLIGMGLDLAGRLRHSDPDGAWAEVAQIRTAASETLTELRTLVRALSPLTTQEATEVDLDAALTRLAGAFNGTGLTVDLVRQTDDEVAGLDPLAYRIIQESLTNVVRHSDARHVTVTVSSGAELQVRISDDGTRSTPVEPGFGLKHLRARVEAAGGTFSAGAGASGFEVAARYPARVPA